MAARTPLSELPGLSESVIQKLTGSGISSIEELADTPIGDLTNIKGVGPKIAEKIIASVKDYYLQASEAASTETATDESEPVREEETQQIQPAVESAEAESSEIAIGAETEQNLEEGEPLADSTVQEHSEPEQGLNIKEK
jgi:transcription termination factor NusA